MVAQETQTVILATDLLKELIRQTVFLVCTDELHLILPSEKAADAWYTPMYSVKFETYGKTTGACCASLEKSRRFGDTIMSNPL